MDKKKVKSIWDNKILWVIISVFASLLLWVYVTSTLGDVTTASFSGVPIEFVGSETIREKEGLVITQPSVNTVTLNMKGTRRFMSKLSSSNLKATIDVSKITAEGWYNFPVTVIYPPGVSAGSITTTSTSPLNVSFSVDKSNTKTIELKGQLDGTVAEGFSPGAFVFDPQTVTITGPEKELQNVSYALVSIERQDVNKTLKFESAYVLMDADGKELELGNIKLEREQVTVTLPINSTKEVPLTVDLVDGGGATIADVKITCVPSSIVIAGDAETLAGINKISVGTIDLASFPLTYEEEFPIVLDNTITNVTGIVNAKITLEIIGFETRKFSVTNISTINAAEGTKASNVTTNVEVTLRGTTEVLNKIKANNIRAVVDLTELGATKGVFQPLAKIYVDGFTGVGAVGQYTVFVKIT